MKWTDVGYIIRSPLSRRIAEVLEKDVLTPFQISKKTKMARSNVSTKLVELRKRNLVVCLNPEDKVGRLYKVTKYGQLVLKEAQKIRGKTSQEINV